MYRVWSLKFACSLSVGNEEIENKNKKYHFSRDSLAATTREFAPFCRTRLKSLGDSEMSNQESQKRVE